MIPQSTIEMTLWILITIYGIIGIGNYYASMPIYTKGDDEILNTKPNNYLFWLISSLIFLLYGIMQFSNITLSYLTIGEIAIVCVSYLIIAIYKKQYLKNMKNKLQKKMKNTF